MSLLIALGSPPNTAARFTPPHHLPFSVGCGTNFVVIKTNASYGTYNVITKSEGHPGTVVPYEYAEHFSCLTFSLKLHSKLLPCSSTSSETWFSVYMIMGIVCFRTPQFSRSYLILVTGVEKVGTIEGKKIFRVTKTNLVSFAANLVQDSTVCYRFALYLSRRLRTTT